MSEFRLVFKLWVERLVHWGTTQTLNMLTSNMINNNHVMLHVSAGMC